MLLGKPGGVMGTSVKTDVGTSVMWNEDWASQAACRVSQPDQLFVRGAEQNKAKKMCAGCPVKAECLAEELENQIEWGVWGGMTERERRALLKRNPNAKWRAVLEQARVGAAAKPVTV